MIASNSSRKGAGCFYTPIWTATRDYGIIPTEQPCNTGIHWRRPMHFAMRVLTVTVLSLLVIETTTGAAETKPSTASVIETLRVGDHCLIGTEERVGWNRRATSSFWGTVKSRSEEQITLTNVATTGRSEHLVPIISRIPYVNRMFKNVGIGASQLAEDDVVVRVKEISSAQVIGEEQLKTVIEDAKNHQFQRVGIDFQ